MIESARSFLSGWGWTYLSQLGRRRLRFPAPLAGGGTVHFILVVANHFEPFSNGWTRPESVHAIRRWCTDLERLGVKDASGHPFKHTYFFPAEQYHREFLEPLAAHCTAGFGEVEVQIHHGISGPDTPEKLEGALCRFVDRLAGHHCLARHRTTGRIGYSFVHGNWALANSAGGAYCGVDNEMEILARTGCFLDCTLPSAPSRAQVGVINSIYQCGYPSTQQAPHRCGPAVIAGEGSVRLPLLLQGPLLVTGGRRIAGLPVPRLENGDLTAEFPPSVNRFQHWARANVHVKGRPEWVFIKLHTHGLLERHRPILLGDVMRATLETLLAIYGDGQRYRLHFATAREAANIILAAVEGHGGDPGQFRNHTFVPLEDGWAGA